MNRVVVRVRPLILSLLLSVLCACSSPASGGHGKTAAAPVLVGIGASDAAGIGSSEPQTKNWVAQLGAHEPGGSRTINLGISGATAAQAEQQELPVALDAGPTVVALWLGVNDIQQNVSIDAFSAALSDILSRLHAQTRARLLIANLPDLTTLPAFGSSDATRLRQTTDAWNAAIASAATANAAELVDLHAAWAALPNRGALLSGDGLHPNDAGYRELADLFWSAIKGGA